VFSLVAPITYLSIRFNLFNSVARISFAGIAVIGIIISVVSLFIKYYLDGMKTKFSYLKQILQGTIRVVIPLGLALLLCVWFKFKYQWLLDNINLCIEALSIILGCEMVAICVNPLPKWCFDNNVEGLVEITDKIQHKGE